MAEIHKEPAKQPSDRLAEAAKHVAVGDRYLHYKQLSYRVVAVALREDDLEPCVVYRAEYGDNLTWIRPVSVWLEDVEVDGEKVKRFTRIERDSP